MEVVVKRGLSGLQQGGAGGEEERRGGCLCTRWTVWILTGGVAVSSRLVRALSRNLVDVVFFDGRGEPVARLFPPDSNGSQKGAARGVFQRQEFELAKLVVNGKIAGQGPQTRRPVEAGAVRGACKSRGRSGQAGGRGVEMRRSSVRVRLRGGGRLGLLGGALLRLRRAGGSSEASDPFKRLTTATAS